MGEEPWRPPCPRRALTWCGWAAAGTVPKSSSSPDALWNRSGGRKPCLFALAGDSWGPTVEGWTHAGSAWVPRRPPAWSPRVPQRGEELTFPAFSAPGGVPRPGLGSGTCTASLCQGLNLNLHPAENQTPFSVGFVCLCFCFLSLTEMLAVFSIHSGWGTDLLRCCYLQKSEPWRAALGFLGFLLVPRRNLGGPWRGYHYLARC